MIGLTTTLWAEAITGKRVTTNYSKKLEKKFRKIMVYSSLSTISKIT